jgi:hypothetical protein
MRVFPYSAVGHRLAIAGEQVTMSQRNLRRLRWLGGANNKRKRLVADTSLDEAMLQGSPVQEL